MARTEIPITVFGADGRPLAGAAATIRTRPGGATAVVYSAETGAATNANPLTSNAQGQVTGWVDRGAYEATITAAGLTTYVEPFESAPATDGTIDALWLPDGIVTTAKIANLGVTLAKLAADSVDASKIVDGSVGTAELAALSVTAAKIANDTITAAQIATDAVGSAEIAPAAVGASEIADGSIGTIELANGAVTPAKMSVTVLQTVAGSKVSMGITALVGAGGALDVPHGLGIPATVVVVSPWAVGQNAATPNADLSAAPTGFRIYNPNGFPYQCSWVAFG